MMIPNTRRQLTIFYSTMIGLILLIMAASFYWVLTDVMHRDERHNLESAGQKAVNEWRNHSPGPQDKEEIREQRQTDSHRMEWEYLQSDQFAVITDPSWTIFVHSPEGNNLLLKPSFQKLLDAQGSKSYIHLSISSGNNRTNYAVLRVMTGDEEHPFLLLGEEVSKQEHLLKEMRLLLIGITLLLLAVATIIGYILAGRAMLPLNHAFIRQQKFTAYASHELRTPLSVLQLSVDILEEEQHKLSPVHQTVLQDMKEEIQRMTRLTGQLLTLARNDSPLQQMRRELFDLKHSLSFAAARMQLVAQEKTVQLQLHIGNTEDTFTCLGDSEQIDQLLYILLDNAIKYSAEGGTVTLGLSRNDNGTVNVIIQDTGCGIPEEDLPHLFERFYRVDQARTREHGGTGLGLAIAHEIVSRHGGRIVVTSTLHQGSTFTVILPETQRILRQPLK
ncbi:MULTISPECIES: cell wall metabolism sensor histidine kinase WalK [unclassified Paenibacillus]|uniref:sensor histidine kinase n=1 Tax=unclassified Paenibacillus TaxID=185978 RepID=UPI0009F855A5|nr:MULTISPECIES: ATP-binding protein [unclassified Paenibacillus]